MRRRARLVLILALGLALAACGGKKEKERPAGGEATATSPAATEEVTDAGYELVPREPGLQLRKGLVLITHSEGVREGTAYYYAQVRNDSGQTLSQVDVVIYPLDSENFELESITGSSMLTDIPPGQTFYVGREFPVPPGFADSQRFVWYTPTAEPAYRGFFDLAATVDFHGMIEGGVYAARGTAQNTSGQDLLFPVIDVALIGPDDNLVGLSHGVLKTSAPGGRWAAGETAAFEALFAFIAGEPDQVTGVQVAAAGYAVPE